MSTRDPGMSAPALPDGLVRYLAERDRQHAENVRLTLGAMTERERRLVREAAVMGYVQGVRAVPGGHQKTIPPDSSVLAQVIDACLAFKDLYPTMDRACRRGVRRAGDR